MSAPTPYLQLPGTAREALEHYRSVFGGDVETYTLEQFGRTDGPPESIAHGQLTGPVPLFASDAGADDAPLRVEGMSLALLGAAEPEVLHAWFDGLAEGGTVISPQETRPWGDVDGTVRDRYGLTWLIGYQTQG